MKIALIGYGKMGKIIDELASKQGHEIVLRATSNTVLKAIDLTNADIAIEFTNPQAVVRNITTCLEAGIPVVSGTTGWNQHYDHIKDICAAKNGTLFHSSNFSIGVNIFFKANEFLANIMNKYNNYELEITEIHHTQKVDAPSGTAITTAQKILKYYDLKKTFALAPINEKQTIAITSIRKDDVPGTHIVSYKSSQDQVNIEHIAHNRTGFAIGAIEAACWVYTKKGIYTMTDMINF